MHARTGATVAAAHDNVDAGAEDGKDTVDVARRINMLWALENAVDTRDFVTAQQLQAELRCALSLPDDALLPLGKDSLQGCEVLVSGGNGRLGSQVVRELLRRGASVRATIRSSDNVRDWERLSYEVGAEEGIGDIQAPWVRKSVEMRSTDRMGKYGLGRLTVIECDLLDEEALSKALRGVDTVIWCATGFNGGVPKFSAPEVLTADALFAVTDGLFLRERRARDAARAESAARRLEGTVDVDGLAMAARLMTQEARRASLVGKGPASLRSQGDTRARLPQFLCVSARDGALPYDKFPPGTVEKFKRTGEQALFKNGPSDAVVVRFSSFAFNDPRYVPPTAEGVGTAGDGADEPPPPPPQPPHLSCQYTGASGPVVEDMGGEGGGVARGVAARVVVLAAVAAGADARAGARREEGSFLTLLA